MKIRCDRHASEIEREDGELDDICIYCIVTLVYDKSEIECISVGNGLDAMLEMVFWRQSRNAQGGENDNCLENHPCTCMC